MMNGLIDQVADAGRCDVVTDIARPTDADHVRAARCASRGLAVVRGLDRGGLSGLQLSTGCQVRQAAILRSWGELDDYVDGMVAARRDTLTDDLLSELIRAESGATGSISTNCAGWSPDS